MDKKNFRTNILSQIAALDDHYIAESDDLIAKNIFSLEEFINAKRVFTYLSVGHEVDTNKLIKFCAENNKSIALPVCTGNGKMHFSEYVPGRDKLFSGSFGILSPSPDAPKLIPDSVDIVIVPGLCYDMNGFRLGHGGGYYDRYLSECKAFSVGLCREELLFDSIPTEPHDLQVDCLITEKRNARPLKVPQI